MKRQLQKWFRNISIKRKLFFVMGIMAFLIAVELFTLWFAVKTLSSVRAYVGGEGLWSKAQKDAGYYLQKYGRTYDESDYQKFQACLVVPLGDAKARMELAKANPDLDVARAGFIVGQNHPEDVDGMIWLFRTFNKVSYIDKAIRIWGEAEPLMIKLTPIGEKLHAEVNSKSRSQEKINIILSEIDPINNEITKLENNFSYTLGEGSRWLEDLILKILVIIAITVEFTGLFLTISVSVTISRGIKEVVRASNSVSMGDFNSPAKIFSTDEIGKLGGSFNKMIRDLNERIKERDIAEERLRKQKEVLENYALKLKESNKDLEQFAYVASHDLREPLRTINSYVQLIENRYKGKLDDDADEFIDFVVKGVNRMDTLITDLLTYSQLGKQEFASEWINCKDILDIVLVTSQESILKSKATIKIDTMPDIYASKPQMVQVFQNLISNSIKFHKETIPELHISAKEYDKEWLFSINDNGIGIDKKYEERIFVIFQRLNSREIYDGTGIGLTICKKIVEKHGGKIWFESELGVGTTFYFTIKKPSKENG